MSGTQQFPTDFDPLVPSPEVVLLGDDGTGPGYMSVGSLGFEILNTNNMGGDITGSPLAATVQKIGGVQVQTSGATIGEKLTFDGTMYAPAADPSTLDAGYF